MNGRRSPITRRHIAVHEAGHAVVARALGGLCGGASIAADDDAQGHAITAELPRGAPLSDMHDAIVVSAAGAEAEIVVLGSDLGGDHFDRIEIAAMMARIAGEHGGGQSEETLRRRARRLVRQHRASVEALADALEANETMTREEVDAALPSSLRSRPVTWVQASSTP